MTAPYADALRRARNIARNHFLRPEVAALMHEPVTDAERLSDYHSTLRTREVIAAVVLLQITLFALLFAYR